MLKLLGILKQLFDKIEILCRLMEQYSAVSSVLQPERQMNENL